MSHGRQSLIAIVAVLSAGIIFFSQCTPLDWDEGFHLVAAMLIAAGKRPYIDFCFPQPYLHAWWNAFWLAVTGGGWRGAHAVAAVLTCGAVALTVDFVHRRLPAAIDPAWRGIAAGCAALLVGLNEIIFEFGTKAQAYGAGTFLTVAAFRAMPKDDSTRANARAFVAGCLAGAAAACSLLTAPLCIVLAIWLAIQRRWMQAIALVGGIILPLLPLLISFATAPYETWFNLVEYHALFRRVRWTGATGHDIEVLTSWAGSGQAVLLAVFAALGLLFIRRSGWTPWCKREFYLALWIAIGLAAEAAVAHPTFPQYFIFIVPFVSMLAAVGFAETVTRISIPPLGAMCGLSILMVVSLGGSLKEWIDDNNNWTNMEALAQQVRKVTPPGAPVIADPPVYFAMHQQPPSGLEFPASEKLEVPDAMALRLHLMPSSLLGRRLRAGEFPTAETCKGDEDEIRSLDLPKLYSQSQTIGSCVVYWGFNGSHPK